jgi:glycogen operon protein
MLLAGDDIGHSQKGNNNAYCQDNASTWLDWLAADGALHAFVARLLQARRARRVLQAHSWWQNTNTPGRVTAQWSTPQNTALNHGAWNDGQQRALVLQLQLGAPDQPGAAAHDPSALQADCLLLINASAQPQVFTLPDGHWLRHIDSATGSCKDHRLAAAEALPPGCLWLASKQPLFTA